MKKPKLEDFNLKKFKMLNKGGAHVEWSYIYSEGNEAHEDAPKLDRTLTVHKDLHDILLRQKGNVLLVEQINYRLAVETAKKMGVNNLEELSTIAEGLTKEAMSTIQINGFSISGKDDKRSVIITYDKMTGDKKIIGRATSKILLSGNFYGFEESLESDIDDFIEEVYAYVYRNKHSESDQLQFDMFQVDEDDIENEEE